MLVIGQVDFKGIVGYLWIFSSTTGTGKEKGDEKKKLKRKIGLDVINILTTDLAVILIFRFSCVIAFYDHLL